MAALCLLVLFLAPSVVCGLRHPPIPAITGNRLTPPITRPKVKCFDHELALRFEDQAVRQVTFGGPSTRTQMSSMCSPRAPELGVQIASAHIFRCLLGVLMLSSLASDTRDGCIFYSRGLYIKFACSPFPADMDSCEVVISGAQKYSGHELYGPLFQTIRIGVILASSSSQPYSHAVVVCLLAVAMDLERRPGRCTCYAVRSSLVPAIRTVLPSIFNNTLVWKDIAAIEEVADGLTGLDFTTHIDPDRAQGDHEHAPYFVHMQVGSCFRWALKGRVEQLHPVIREFADNFTDRFSYIEDLVAKGDFELHGTSKSAGALSEAAWYFTHLSEFAFLAGEKPELVGSKPLCLPPILSSLPSM